MQKMKNIFFVVFAFQTNQKKKMSSAAVSIKHITIYTYPTSNYLTNPGRNKRRNDE